MPYVEREKGVRIHYNHYGRGFPLVFLHGFSANAWLWAFQAPVLAYRYHCIVIEARGHGLSSKPLSGYSIQDMAADDVPRPWPPSALTGRFWSAIRWAGYGPCR